MGLVTEDKGSVTVDSESVCDNVMETSETRSSPVGGGSSVNIGNGCNSTGLSSTIGWGSGALPKGGSSGSCMFPSSTRGSTSPWETPSSSGVSPEGGTSSTDCPASVKGSSALPGMPGVGIVSAMSTVGCVLRLVSVSACGCCTEVGSRSPEPGAGVGSATGSGTGNGGGSAGSIIKWGICNKGIIMLIL